MSANIQKRNISADTLAAQSGINVDNNFNSVVPPLYMSSNFQFDNPNEKPSFDYSRGGNPTRDLLASTLAELESGAGAVVTSSGMSAINLVLQLLTPKDVIALPKDCYGGTYRLITSLAEKGAFNLVWVDYYSSNFEQQAVELSPSLFWVETPSNPTLQITDIKKVVCAAKTVNAKVVVDNTFLSPLGCNPILLGADFVVHSNTKYINGHGDVVSGAVVSKSVADHEQLAWWANNTGVTGSPFDSYLILRGVRTLGVRVKQHSENALAVAQFLEAHDSIEKVFYPGLESHAQYSLAKKQHRYQGGMLSITLNASELQIETFIKSLTLFTLAESLGGTESLICQPSTMTHAAMPADAQKAAGISPNLIRLSVGIESKTDLIADLEQALRKATQVKEDKVAIEPISKVTKTEEGIEKSEACCRLSPALAALW
jgi:cystathionine gamma-synthase